MDAVYRSRLVRVLDSRVTTRAVQVIAVLSLFLSLVVGGRQYALADCLANYNDQQARASGQRLEAAEEDRQALDTMVSAVVNAKERGDAARALVTYLETRRQSDLKRAQNPPPAPPSEACR